MLGSFGTQKPTASEQFTCTKSHLRRTSRAVERFLFAISQRDGENSTPMIVLNENARADSSTLPFPQPISMKVNPLARRDPSCSDRGKVRQGAGSYGTALFRFGLIMSHERAGGPALVS